MSVIVLNRSVIHYESLGRGRAVLFLHTWIGSWRYWVPSLQAAAAAHSAYALDLYGFGESAREPERYSIEGQSALLGGFLDEMGIDRTAIVGHGLGALVALQFAASHPERVARFMAVGIPLLQQPAADGAIELDHREGSALLGAIGDHADVLLPETSTADPRARQQGLGPAEIRGLLVSVQLAYIPMLIVNGASDPLNPGASSEQLAELGTLVHEIVLPEVGHFPMLESADSFHRLMVDFLALDSGSSPRDIRLKEEWRRRVR